MHGTRRYDALSSPVAPSCPPPRRHPGHAFLRVGRACVDSHRALPTIHGREYRLYVEIAELAESQTTLLCQLRDRLFETSVPAHRVVGNQNVARVDLVALGEGETSFDAVFELAGMARPR